MCAVEYYHAVETEHNLLSTGCYWGWGEVMSGIFLAFNMSYEYYYELAGTIASGSRNTLVIRTKYYHHLDRNTSYFIMSAGCYFERDGGHSGIFHGFTMSYEYYHVATGNYASSSRYPDSTH